MPVASDGNKRVHFVHDSNSENPPFMGLVGPLTCDGEVARAVGLSSAVLSEACVDPLVVLGGVEDLQAPIKQDGNAKGKQISLAKLTAAAV